METTNNKSRLTYIDVARAIGILSVVLGHLCLHYRDARGISNDQMIIFIYTFHMPLFFILSGILFSEKSFKEISFKDFLLKKIKTLIIPYLFLDLTAGIYTMVESANINLESLKTILRYTFTGECNVGADWFLLALFMGEIGVYFFLKYYRNIFKYLAWIPFLLIEFYYPFSTHWINVMVRGVIAFTFILAGYLLKEYYKSDINMRWDVIVLSFFVTFAVSEFNGQIEIWASKIGNPLLCMVGGLAGAYWIIGLSKHITSKLLVFIGQNTMTMMGTHMIVLGLVVELCSKTIFAFKESLAVSIYGQILMFALIIICNLPIMYLYNRYLPFFIGKSRRK